MCVSVCFFFQAEDGIRDLVRSRGLGDVYKRQVVSPVSVRKKRTQGGNELSVMFAELPTHLNSIEDEFEFMSSSFSNAKIQLSDLGTETLGEVSRVAPWTALGKLWGLYSCLLYTSPSPRDRTRSRMPSSA